MIRVMFVCLGNICRSPMGEFILKKLTAERGIEDQFEIASCAVSREEVGNPVYPPAREVLRRHGISCEGKRSRQVTRSDYERYDHFLCMDSSNVRRLKSIFPNDPKGKIHLLLDYAGGGEVADPWWTDDFDTAYQDIERGCVGFLNYLSSH